MNIYSQLTISILYHYDIRKLSLYELKGCQEMKQQETSTDSAL
jgi:hypothetical protein